MPNESDQFNTAEHQPSNTPHGSLIPSAENCRIYQEEKWWLPDAYVENATCACTDTADSPEMNCIRGHLQEQLAGIDANFKLRGSRIKRLVDPPFWPVESDVALLAAQPPQHAHLASDVFALVPIIIDPNAASRARIARQRQAFLRDFTDLIYSHHVLAYAACGCGSGPAWAWTWELVTRIGTPCWFIAASIAVAGQCNPRTEE